MRIIDADALMERLKAWDTNDAIDKALYNFALNRVLEAPTVEPERKTGRWIFHETQNDRYDDIICPFCKKTYAVDAYRIDDIGFTAEDFNYCPNCGSYNGGEREWKC